MPDDTAPVPSAPDPEGKGAPEPELTEEDMREVSTVPLEDAEGNEVRVTQQNAGSERSVGGGEFPDPDTPPSEFASGSD